MKKINTTALLDDLQNRLNEMTSTVNSIAHNTQTALAQKPGEGKWSALECLEHLNRYADFYIPVFAEAVAKATKKPHPIFKPGWLGGKAAKDMLPENGEVKNKMKTFKSKDPDITGEAKPDAIEVFTGNQQRFLELVNDSRSVNLAKRVKTTLPLIKFKLGDALRFVIFHEVRHIDQAQKALGEG